MALKRIYFLMLIPALLMLPSKALGYYYNLSGYVYNSSHEPLPFATVYVKELQTGVTTDLAGKYHLELPEGTYEIVYSMLGYTEQRMMVTMTDDKVQNIWLQESAEGLEEITVMNKKKDPAYEIIELAIQNRDRNKSRYNSLRNRVYIKAGEISELERIRKKDSLTPQERLEQTGIVEVYLERNFQQPGNIKEIVDGYDCRGEQENLYFLSANQTNLDFYNNLLRMDGLCETPIISPLSRTSMLAYKFKLDRSFPEDGELVYQIEVIPRRLGNKLFHGWIQIIEGSFAIKRLKLSLGKGATILYDELEIYQEYDKFKDSIYLVTKQQFTYTTDTWRKKFTGQTLVKYSDFEINPTYKKNYFSNEVGIIIKEAYERDSTYWQKIRPEPLSVTEQKFIHRQDSMEAVMESEWYLDSVQRETNRLTLKNLLFMGQAIVNHKKQRAVYLSSLAGMAQPFDIGGFRLGYWVYYRKKFKSARKVNFFPSLNYGLRNRDLKGSINFSYKYDPMKNAWIHLSAGRQFDLVNPYDAYINMFKRSNYFENQRVRARHRMELVNGMYSEVSIGLSNRKPIAGRYQFGSLTDGWFENNTPPDFSEHNALYASIGLEYTPGQKFIREPYEKVILGSKYPTFNVNYTKGVNGLLGSVVNFDYLELGITQDIKLGTGGTSKYRISGGKFLNTDSLPIVDRKYQRMGDPIIYTDPLTTFQMLESTFPTYDWYLEGHYIHHFNGAIFNKLPIIKKTRLRAVAGGSMLQAFGLNYRHIEGFAGLERVIRIVREQFRVGVYVAAAESNQTPVNAAIKVSIEYFDKQRRNWGF